MFPHRKEVESGGVRPGNKEPATIADPISWIEPAGRESFAGRTVAAAHGAVNDECGGK
ncbi:MAG: hypothetical protein ACE15F_14820 [bacterium]